MGDQSLVRGWDYLEQYVTLRYGDSLLWKEYGFHLWYPLARGGFSYLTHGDNDIVFGILSMFFPIHWSYIWHRIITIFMSSLGMYLFIRDLRDIGEVGSALGGILFGFVVNIIYEDVFTPAWFPLFFFAANRAIRSNYFYKTLLTGLLLGFVLYNHVRIGLVQAPIHLVLVLTIFAGTKHKMWKVLLKLCVIWIIGLIIFSPFLFELASILPTATRNLWGESLVQDFYSILNSFLRPLTYLGYFSEIGIIPYIGLVVGILSANKPQHISSLIYVIVTMLFVSFFLYPILTLWTGFDDYRFLRNIPYIKNTLPVFVIPISMWGLVNLAKGDSLPKLIIYFRTRRFFTSLIILLAVSLQFYRIFLAWRLAPSFGSLHMIYASVYLGIVLFVLMLFIRGKLDVWMKKFSGQLLSNSMISKAVFPILGICIFDSWYQTLRFASVNLLAMSSFQAVSHPAYQYIYEESNIERPKTAVVWQTAVQSVAPPKYGVATINGYASVVSDSYASFWMALIDPILSRSEVFRDDYINYPRRLTLYWDDAAVEERGNLNSILRRPLLNLMGVNYISSGREILDSDKYDLTPVIIEDGEKSLVPWWANTLRDFVGLSHQTKPPFWHDVYLYHNENVFPEAWITFGSIGFSNKEDLIRGLASASNQDLLENVYLLNTEVDNLFLPNSDITPIGEVNINDYHPDRIAFNVYASQPGMLVYPDNYSLGWYAKVNGMDSDLVKAYGTFKGVVVPEGHSEIVMYYRPYYTFLSIQIAVAMFVIIVLWSLYAMFNVRLVTNK